MIFKLYDVVRASVAINEHGVPAGTKGTIVHVHDESKEDYIVEFVDTSMRTIAVVDVHGNQLMAVR
jgi:Domain of unknown function (DUF4926)